MTTSEGQAMEQWHYDPAVDLDQHLVERLRSMSHQPDFFVSGARSLASTFVRSWLRLYHRLTIVGRHNLPAERSFLLVSNHASHLDTLCLLAALPMAQLNRTFPAAAKDYFCVSASRAFLARVLFNALPFERHFAPWQSLAACSKLLEQPGTVLILFPEGTRSTSAEPGDFKPGVALLAAGRDIPVVPCHLAGTHVALPKGSWFPRPSAVRLTIGTPRFYAHLPPTKESAKQICHELREAVVHLGSSNNHECPRRLVERPVH